MRKEAGGIKHSQQRMADKEKKGYRKQFSAHSYPVTNRDGEVVNKMYFTGEVTCTKDANFHPGEDGGKKSFAVVGAAAGSPVGMILDVAKGKYDKEKEYQDFPFLEIKAFGYGAVNLSKIAKKGANLAVSGNLDVEEYKTNEGQKKKKVVLSADMAHLIDKSPFFKDGGRKTKNAADSDEDEPKAKNTSTSKPSKPAKPEPEDDDDDMDIPF